MSEMSRAQGQAHQDPNPTDDMVPPAAQVPDSSSRASVHGIAALRTWAHRMSVLRTSGRGTSGRKT